jgi:hypothetical protein
MFKSVKVRNETGEGKDVIIAVKRWWLEWLPDWNLTYYRYGNRAAQVNRTKRELFDLIDQIEDKILTLRTQEEDLNSERRDVKNLNYLGVGLPYWTKRKNLHKFQEFVADPGDSWKGVFHPSFLAKLGVGRGGGKSENKSQEKASGGTLMLLKRGDEVNRKYLDVGDVDQFGTFPSDEPKKGGGKDSGAEKSKAIQALRNRIPMNEGESGKEYSKRLNGLYESRGASIQRHVTSNRAVHPTRKLKTGLKLGSFIPFLCLERT